MSVPATLSSLVGDWAGLNRLWLSPDDPVRESATRAVIDLAAEGQFLTLRYTWADGGVPQSGLLVCGQDPSAGSFTASWIDSWHMRDAMMVCRGVIRDEGVSIQGSYPAPPGPDWGWRIEVLPERDDTFRLIMYNISPDGRAELAVEATYRRA